MSTMPAPMPHWLPRFGDCARQRAAAVNAELTLLYWQVGRRIHQDILGARRADYGAAIVATLSRQLTSEYGKGWGERRLRNCLRFAEVFADEAIVHTLCAQLSWSHLRVIEAHGGWPGAFHSGEPESQPS